MKRAQNKILTEIYRRLNFFHHGNLNEPLMLLALPSEVKCIKDLCVITPYGKEQQRALNWYKLTEKGKLYFSNHIEKISDETNFLLFTGVEIKLFQEPSK